jgi:hypothetical protein
MQGTRAISRGSWDSVFKDRGERAPEAGPVTLVADSAAVKG